MRLPRPIEAHLVALLDTEAQATVYLAKRPGSALAPLPKKRRRQKLAEKSTPAPEVYAIKEILPLESRRADESADATNGSYKNGTGENHTVSGECSVSGKAPAVLGDTTMKQDVMSSPGTNKDMHATGDANKDVKPSAPTDNNTRVLPLPKLIFEIPVHIIADTEVTLPKGQRLDLRYVRSVVRTTDIAVMHGGRPMLTLERTDVSLDSIMRLYSAGLVELQAVAGDSASPQAMAKDPALVLRVEPTSEFYNFESWGPKCVFLDHIWGGADDPTPKTVDLFYRQMHIAPHTNGGLPVVGDVGNGVGKHEERRGQGEEEKGTIAPDAMPPPDPPLRPPNLMTTLHPFQSRSVRWMLYREGKMSLDGRTVQDLPADHLDALKRGPLWRPVEVDAQRLWYNAVAGTLVPSLKEVEADELRGSGLLCEEMGLGKTCEVIALLLMHQDVSRDMLPRYFDDTKQVWVQPSRLSLIVVPTTILAQWQTEMSKHAPSLRLLEYGGYKTVKGNLDGYDAVITTFDVLRRELVVSRRPHERSLRSGQGPSYERSLLVKHEFLRVITDEAQMLGSAFSTSSEMVSLIPRKFSLAVTGTPLRQDISDLRSLFLFLQVPYVAQTALFARFLANDRAFRELVGCIGQRTLKADVEKEVVLPPQHRFLIPTEFSALERYSYNTQYIRALEEMGLNTDGSLRFEPDGSIASDVSHATLQNTLATLRQLCTHFQVNSHMPGGSRTLRTVAEVLVNMREAVASTIQSEVRSLLVCRLRRGQLMMREPEQCTGLESALELFKGVAKDIEPLIDSLVTDINECWRSTHIHSVQDALGAGLDDDDTPAVVPETLTDKIRANRLGALRNRLRDFVLVQHSAYFFAGNALFNLGKFAEDEAAAYDRAEAIRKQLLRFSDARVRAVTARIRSALEKREEREPLANTDMEVAFSGGGGILARTIFEDIAATSDALNGLAEVLWGWRERIVAMMFTRVALADEDVTGEEYEQSADLQQRLDIYLELYTAGLAEWRAGLTGEVVAGAVQGGGGSTGGPAKAEKGRGRGRNAPRRPPPQSKDEPETEAEALRRELLEEKAEILDGAVFAGVPSASVTSAPPLQPLRPLLKRLQDRSELSASAMETKLVTAEVRRLRDALAHKEKVLERLSHELTELLRVFNARVEYFRQLQVISDSVADIDMDGRGGRGYAHEIALTHAEEQRRIATVQAKESEKRYLTSLSADGHEMDSEQTCVICSDTYQRGVLTACGHLFCIDCFWAWRAKSTQCGLCKRPLPFGSWKMVQYGGDEETDEKGSEKNDSGDGVAVDKGAGVAADPTAATATATASTSANATTTPSASQLSFLSRKTIAEIEDIPSHTNISSKSEFLVKHIKYLKQRDPLVKAVVYSTWSETVEVIMSAFRFNNISFVRLEGPGRRAQVVKDFQENPSVTCFILQTQAQAAGLNLVCAQHLFLMEPLLHSSLELQAVGRVHRIGQTAETYVYQLYIEDTVEERIVSDLKVRNGTSLFLKNRASSSQEALLLERDVASAGKRGARVGKKGSSENKALSNSSDDDLLRTLLTPGLYEAYQRSLAQMSM